MNSEIEGVVLLFLAIPSCGGGGAAAGGNSSKTKGGGVKPTSFFINITAAVCSHYFRNNVIFIVKDWVILLRASLCSSIDLGRLRACLPARSGTFEAKY
mmetsp:Transcript_22672/g.34184  ORF Transcript_22672/g.34184 Transcript_22672/m.34184 type:complete len:99 (+) Transcript_22672:1261-1557(+)